MSYRMKAVMEKTGLTEKTIRYYIEKSLLQPEEKINNGRVNYYFNETQLQVLDEICILRSYGFTIQDIKAVFTGQSNYIQNMLREYFSSLERQQQLALAWSEISINADEIQTREQLIGILREHQNILWKETHLQPNFKEMDEEEDNSQITETSIKNKRPRFHLIASIFVLLVGLLSGFFLGSDWTQHITERKVSAEQFHYGFTQNDIIVTDVEWKEFPVYRNVSFHIQGNFTVNVPTNTDISFVDLESENSIRETDREHQVFSDGEELLYYDCVSYEITDGFIAAIGLLKESENAITAATQGYRIRFTSEDGNEYCLGYIPTRSSRFEKWTMQQSQYAKQDLTPYLGAFTLSHTYGDFTLLTALDKADKIQLIKKDGGLLDCVINNTGTADWEYSATLPSLEMWYRGVWIEMKPKWDDALISGKCPGMQDQEIMVPAKTTEEYPDLFPGLYRLVIYGTEGDYAASDSFVVKYED